MDQSTYCSTALTVSTQVIYNTSEWLVSELHEARLSHDKREDPDFLGPIITANCLRLASPTRDEELYQPTTSRAAFKEIP